MKMEQAVEEKLRHLFDDNTLHFDKTRFAGGLTNYNYIMTIKDREYVIRQPGNMTHLMIDRKTEKRNNAIASEIGVNSDCIYFDEETGIKISVYIPNSKNLAKANPQLPQHLTAVSNLIKTIHTSSEKFYNVFDWIQELEKYESIIEECNGSLFFDYHTLKQDLLNLCAHYQTTPTLYPCHNDTVPENFLIDEQQHVYLIDWEYAGMNDVTWDLAAYILESKLSQEAADFLLEEYYQEVPPQEAELSIKLYILAQDLLWTAWALIRHYNGEDFLDYCAGRYNRFRKNMKLFTNNPSVSIGEMVKYE